MWKHTAASAGRRFLILVVVLFVIIMGSVTALALTDKISTDAVAFLLGTVITGAIAIVRDFMSAGT